MNRFARRGIAAVAAGMLALGLSACGGTGDASSSSSDDDTALGDEETVGTLGCDDLGDQVWTHAPDPELSLSETPDEDFDALATWMVENGPDFEDEELGAAVSDWGTLGAQYFNALDGTGDEISDEDAETFETAGTLIDGQCPDLGFGFEEDQE